MPPPRRDGIHPHTVALASSIHHPEGSSGQRAWRRARASIATRMMAPAAHVRRPPMRCVRPTNLAITVRDRATPFGDTRTTDRARSSRVPVFRRYPRCEADGRRAPRTSGEAGPPRRSNRSCTSTSATLVPANPSHRGMGPGCWRTARASAIALRRTPGSLPATRLVPSSQVIGRSFVSRSVTHGTRHGFVVVLPCVDQRDLETRLQRRDHRLDLHEVGTSRSDHHDVRPLPRWWFEHCRPCRRRDARIGTSREMARAQGCLSA